MIKGDNQKARDFSRFMQTVQVGPLHDCWLWTGTLSAANYGVFSVLRKPFKAHRWIYELVVAPIPRGLVLRHRCDNPPCVNPLHMEPGTMADNNWDKVRRGRCNPVQGADHPQSVLTEDDVLRMRTLASLGYTTGQLMEIYPVSRSHVSAIVRRQAWRHIQ